LERNLGPAQIERQGRERQVTLVSNLENNLGVGTAVDEINKRLATI
jgi:hypothetical protein